MSFLFPVDSFLLFIIRLPDGNNIFEVTDSKNLGK